MANYECAVRTNYFRVKDEAGFLAFMKRVTGEDAVEVWEQANRNSGTDDVRRFAFGCYGSICGLLPEGGDPWEDDPDYDAFIEGLQKFVADDDAILIFEAGNEKLRYVIGQVTVITSKKTQFTSLELAGLDLAAKLLGIQNFTTQIDY